MPPYRAPDGVVKYAFCMLCGSEGPAGSACEACSVARPVPGSEPLLRGAICPRCNVATLAIAPATSCVVHACPRCHGVFVPPLAWDFFLTHPERVGELEAKLPPAPGERGDLIASVHCPACDKEMDRLRFAGTSEIVVDTCTAAHGSWLDGGELGSVVRFLAKRDAGGADSEELVSRMRVAAEEARASPRRMEVLAPAPKASQGGDTPSWFLGFPVLLLILTLSGLWERCGGTSRPQGSSSPGQRAIDSAAASSERELREPPVGPRRR